MHALRDLAAKIEALAKEHEAYSQAQPTIQNCVDHLSAIARTYEAAARVEEIREYLGVNYEHLFYNDNKLAP